MPNTNTGQKGGQINSRLKFGLDARPASHETVASGLTPILKDSGPTPIPESLPSFSGQLCLPFHQALLQFRLRPDVLVAQPGHFLEVLPHGRLL